MTLIGIFRLCAVFILLPCIPQIFPFGWVARMAIQEKRSKGSFGRSFRWKSDEHRVFRHALPNNFAWTLVSQGLSPRSSSLDPSTLFVVSANHTLRRRTSPHPTPHRVVVVVFFFCSINLLNMQAAVCNQPIEASVDDEEESTPTMSLPSAYLGNSSHHHSKNSDSQHDDDDERSVSSCSSQRSRTTRIALRPKGRTPFSVRVKNSLDKSGHGADNKKKEEDPLGSSNHSTSSQRSSRGRSTAGRIGRRLHHVREVSKRGRRSVDDSPTQKDDGSLSPTDAGDDALPLQISIDTTPMPESVSSPPPAPIDFDDFSTRGSRSIDVDDDEDDDDDGNMRHRTTSLLCQDALDMSEVSHDEDLLEDLGDFKSNTMVDKDEPVNTSGNGSQEPPKVIEETSKHSSKSLSKSGHEKKKKKKKDSKKSKSDKKEKKDKKNKKKKESKSKTEAATVTKAPPDPNRSLYEDVERISVQVLVHKGEGLTAKDRDFFGKYTSSDPYVEVWRNLPTTLVAKTDYKHHTLEPVFEARFKVAWTHKDLSRSLNSNHRAKVMFKILDHDALSGPDSMGECSIPVPLPCEKDTISKQWIDVDKLSARNARGRLQVSIRVKYEMRES